MVSVPDVSIIIVSYNVAGMLEKCLRSIFERTEDGLAVEVIVVDNASHDGSLDIVKNNFPMVFLIENKHNYGFPKACNQGLRTAKGRYLFFLNPDAKLQDKALPDLVNFMEKHPRAGIAGPKLLFPDGTPQPNRRRFPDPLLALVESTPLQRWFPFKNWKTLRRFYCEDQPEDQNQKVDWLVGAAFVVRREVTDQIGGLDERFFMYSEETDFCRRAGQNGWECWYLPEAVVTHMEGSSSTQNLALRQINFSSSKVSYFRKHYGPLYGEFLRLYLLGLTVLQFIEDEAKIRLGHKVQMRKERQKIYRQALKNGFRPYNPSFYSDFSNVSDLEIGLLSAEFAPHTGGVGDFTAQLAKALKDQGTARVEIITGPALETCPNPEKHKTGFSSRFFEIELASKIDKLSHTQAVFENLSGTSGTSGIFDNEKLKMVEKGPFEVFRLPTSDWNWGSLPQIYARLNQRPVKILIIQYQTGAYGMHPAVNFLPLYLWWKLGANRPLILTTFHDLRVPYLFPKAGPIREWVNRILMRSSHKAVVTNPEDYATALRWHVKPRNLSLIQIGSNITPPVLSSPEKKKIRSEARAAGDYTEKDFVTGYFGLLNYSKGIDLLLKAHALLRQEDGGENYRLLIIGGETGGSDPTNLVHKREIEKLIIKLQLEKVVTWTGRLAPGEISKALWGLDAVVLPFRDGASFRRGSLLAAFAHGLPVVTTKSNIPPNMDDVLPAPNKLPQLLSGQNVFLVESGNVSDLCRALQQLRADPAIREVLASGALELSRSFSWTNIAKAYLNIISEERSAIFAEAQRQAVEV